MLRVGLTGGLACGKSTVAHLMAAGGAQVLDADRLAHELMQPGQAVYAAAVKHFGPEIVHKDGTLDRQRLAELAFAGGRVKELNAIVHPAVIARQEAWMAAVGEADPGAIAVVEAALILEAGVGKRFDRIVVVVCAEAQRVERYAARGPAAAEADARAEARRRIAAQMPDAEKIKAADHVIHNDGSPAALQPQVDAMMRELRRAAAGSEKR